MKKITKLTALLLILCIAAPMLVGFAPLQKVAITQAEMIGESEQTIVQETFDTFDLPDIVSREEAISEGYVGRIKSQEKDLYSLVFDNGDGTSTMKIYSHPVKYVDALGQTRDISLDLRAASDGSYESASHSVITTFEKKLTDGISLKHEDVDIRLVPQSVGKTAPSAKLSSDSKTVSYALDSKTAYVYELTYSGFKEDIVVKEYTGQTEYEFTIYTNGLTLCEQYGSYYLADSDGNIAATIGDIIIFTADDRNNAFGSMTYETVRAGQEYKMTIHVDAEYLKDEKTAYPIRIDPTVEVKHDSGAGSVQDVTLNSNAGSSGSSTALMIGNRSGYGISRALMKFPGLSFDDIPNADCITNAYIRFRDLMCESASMVMYCHRFTGNEWTESSATWATVNPNSYETTPLSSNTLSYSNGLKQIDGHWYRFDITSAVKLWMTDSSAKNKGVIFKTSDSIEGSSTYIQKTMGSYNRSDCRPTLTVVYSYSAAISLNTYNTSVAEGSTVTLSATTTPAGLAVTWDSDNESIATVANGVVTGIKPGSTTITASVTDSEGNVSSVSCTVYVHVPNGVYYIKNTNSNYYLMVDGGYIYNYSPTIQVAKYTNAETSALSKIRQTWKIYYLGDGYYSIRPMHKLDMGLDVDAFDVGIYEIGTTDTLSGVASYFRWTIQWDTNGYTFKNQGESTRTMQIENASTESGASVVVGTYTANANCRWELENVQSVPSGVLLYQTDTSTTTSNPTKYVAPEETRTLADMDMELAYYSGSDISQTFRWTSSDTSVATVISSTGAVTGKAFGTVTITGTHVNSSLTCTYTLQVTGIANGTYYIRNKQTEYYADIQGPTMADGTTIHQWQFHGNNSQKWIFEHQGNGFYTIRSANSTTPYYLGVINDEVVVNSDIVLRDDDITGGMLWNVSVTDSGAFKLTAQKGYALDYALATTTSDQTNGAKLIHGAYVDNDSYRDEWELANVMSFRESHVPSVSLTLQCIGETITNNMWYPIVVSAIEAWNNSAVSANISLSESTSSYTITVVNSMEDWYGLATSIKSGNITTEAIVQINATTLPSNSNIKQSTIAHEIGHLLGLADNPPYTTSNESLMNHSRDRTTIIIPVWIDEYNVRFIYNID